MADEPGVTTTDIKLGQVSARTGGAAASSLAYSEGSRVYFEKVNKTGGVNGRKISVVFYNDDYDPEKVAVLSRKLIDEDKVFALVNYNGVPTSKAAIPIAREKRVPMLFPRNIDSSLRMGVDKFTFHLKPTMFEEVAGATTVALEKFGVKRIAMIEQDDGFAQIVHGGAVKAIRESKKGELVGQAKVPRSGEGMAEAFKKVESLKPDAVILGTSSGVAEKFLKEAKEAKKDWIFIGSNHLNGIMNSMVSSKLKYVVGESLPHPQKSDWEIAKEFRKTIAQDAKAANYVNDYIAFEGYLAAAVVCEALKRAGLDLTRASLIEALESKPFEIGGFAISWTKKDHEGSKAIYNIVISDGTVSEP